MLLGFSSGHAETTSERDFLPVLHTLRDYTGDSTNNKNERIDIELTAEPDSTQSLISIGDQVMSKVVVTEVICRVRHVRCTPDEF